MAGRDPADVDAFNRVVTVVDAEGRSIVESQGAPPLVTHPRHPQQVLTDLWSIDALPASYQASGDRGSFRLQPAGAGVRIIRNKLPPDALMYLDAQGRPRTPGPSEYLHRTRTIDFIQVLEGELWLILEGGEEVRLEAGDCVVQRGTVHAWRNRSEEPVTFLAVLVAADESTLPAPPEGAAPLSEPGGH
jgi:mannose-6-phosphate isomerase-like protein (cupin superfamily)